MALRHHSSTGADSIDSRAQGSSWEIVTEFTYDDEGNLTRKIEAVGANCERKTTFTYDEVGQLLSASIAADAVTQSATIALTYTGEGNLATFTDPEGNQSEFLEYDNMGNLLKMKRSSRAYRDVHLRCSGTVDVDHRPAWSHDYLRIRRRQQPDGPDQCGVQTVRLEIRRS